MSFGQNTEGAFFIVILKIHSKYLSLKKIKNMEANSKKIIVEILKKYGAKSIGIFGSRARGTHRPDSDLDILVDFVKSPSLLQFVLIENELSESLNLKIDLVTENALSPYIADQIHSELIKLYVA